MWKRDEKRKPLFVKPHRVRKTFYALLILAAAFGVIRYGILPVVWRVQANSLARQFEENPSDELADRLVVMIDRRAFSRKRGGEVLEMLLRPKIEIRNMYPLGMEIRTMLRQKPRHFNCLYVLQRTWQMGWMGGDKVVDKPRIYFPVGRPHNANHVKQKLPYANYNYAGISVGLSHPLPTSRGKYTQTIGFRYEAFPVPRRIRFGQCSFSRRFPWNYLPVWLENYPCDFTGTPAYSCEFSVPVEFNIVPPEEVHEVTLVSNAELDAQMVASVTPFFSIGGWRTDSTEPDIMQQVDGVQIHFAGLPENVSFRPIFVSKDGTEIPLSKGIYERLVLRSGTKQFYIYDVPIMEITSGLQSKSFEGTLVFRPDLEAAYAHFPVKTIWGGELTFPISWPPQVTRLPTPEPE